MSIDAPEAELIEFLQEDIPSRTSGEPVSVLELVGPSSTSSIGARMARFYPETSWIVAGGSGDPLEDIPPNLFQVEKLTPGRIQRMHRSPQMFEYLIISDFVAMFLQNQQQDDRSWNLGMLLSVARYTVVYTTPATGIASMFQQKLKETGESLVAAAETINLGLFVKHQKGSILTAEATSLVRPVQHHYDDRRAASEGGTCFKYKLFHKTSTGIRGTPWLCQVAPDPSLKGPAAPRTIEECPADPECDQRTIKLQNSNWVNLKLLAALGVSGRDNKRITEQFLGLPEFKDCPTWNVCVAGSSLVWCDSDAKGLEAQRHMSEHLNSGCARLDVGMKYEANPACCLDLLTAALDEDHCGMDEEEAQSLNIGHAFELKKVKACRIKHFGTSGFSSMKFQDSFVDDAQESFVFGSGREPSRMTKDEIVNELRELGLSTDVKPESSKLGLGNAKEQLIERLEQARLDVSTLSPEELDADLKAMALSTAGLMEDKLARLKTVRQLAYKRVKSKLFRGRIKNRITQLGKSVDGLSKDELKDYAMEAGVSDHGNKEELVKQLKAAWKRKPELKAKAIADLEKQLSYGDALFDIKMGEKEEKARRNLPAPAARPGLNSDSFGLPMWHQQPTVWDAGSIEDLGRDAGLGAPNVKHMSKKELLDEAKASGMSTEGTKQQLQAVVEKARRLGKSPAAKVVPQQFGGQEPQQRFGGSGSMGMPGNFMGMMGGGYMPNQLNSIADGLLQSASTMDDHKSPEKMSRQALVSALEERGIPTQGHSKEKLIEAAKKAGIQKADGGSSESTKGIQMFMQQMQQQQGRIPGQQMAMPRGMMHQGGMMMSNAAGGSLRERLMAREQMNWGRAGSAGGAQKWDGGRSRRQPSRGADRVAGGQLATDMSKEALAAALQVEGLQTQGTKEELLDRLVTRMTKEEMQEQAKMMKLDSKGTKMELKHRIVANKSKSGRGRRLLSYSQTPTRHRTRDE